MTTLVIPVRSDFKSYSMKIELELVIYTLSFGYNTRRGRWYMDISDQAGNDILTGVPILINIPLCDQYIVNGLPPGRFIAIDQSGNNKIPGEDDLGNDVQIFYEESA
jgi:hypothetical protein